MRLKGSHILNYLLSAIFLLAFSLKDLHPIFFHDHAEEICTDTKTHFHNIEFDGDCFICDLYFSLNGTSEKPGKLRALAPEIVLTALPVEGDPERIFSRLLPARAPPVL